ncbi:ABC transporter ATP-binding protein [Streptococcus gordonii]|uniref:ABC transporter ATP-binding protein n=1 Tax=Streptococcus gordonii TaxID=1302 RepID=UPI001CBCE3A5|nr:ABC transporter ATP-binding protein [Streptococcus gordonii]MBZ2133868.1 ABC transporter ATP-binding protein [Streptococcus gordonii]MBZ2142336.1 ABC transporter ATP-binding protein [Streptococcus gordonii]MBZ2144150.1 ABC transporter ATP-binding protein [Streptococcus gordonii]MBZ2146255.1 ABC transporter ATP-binding protein [Streptococcus gordonii]
MEIRLKNIKKNYGSFEALKGIDLVLEEGKFYGLLGPNGAGKTTLFNLLIQNFKQSSGDISWEVDGRPLSTKDFYRHIGIVFQSNRLDENLTVEENLVSRGALYGLSKAKVLERMKDLQNYLDVASIKNKKYGSLSGGQKRKVDIARALLPKPSLLLLDEPTTGLDPQSRHDLWDAINQLNKKDNMTVVLITHYLEEMAGCDILHVLISGNLYYSGDIETFIKKHSTTNLNLRLKEGQSVTSLSVSQFMNKCQVLSEREIVFKDVSVEEMMEIISENQDKSIIEAFNVEYSNLEAAYLNLLKETGGEMNV